MSETIEVTGMVLSVMPIGEHDKRVLLLTKELGRVSAFARGARRQNSTLQAATRPFTFGVFGLYPGSSAYSLQSASVKEYFTGIAADMEAIAYGCYFMELAEYYSMENTDGGPMLNLLYVTMKALLNPKLSSRLVRIIYEWRVFVLQGEYPQVFKCNGCLKELTSGTFSVSKAGLFCESCAASLRDGIVVSEAAVYTLQYIFSAPLTKLYTFVLKEEVEEEVWGILCRFREVYQNRKFKSLEVLQALTK